jgi:hypothetical protein
VSGTAGACAAFAWAWNDPGVILWFLPLAAAIALVCGGTRRDSPREIAWASGRIFAYLVLGTAGFSLMLHLSLQVSWLFFLLLGILVFLLVYYTWRELREWKKTYAKYAVVGATAVVLIFLDRFAKEAHFHWILKLLVLAAVFGVYHGIEALFDRFSKGKANPTQEKAKN